MKTCPHCKKEIPDGITVCPHPGCGKSLAGVGAAARPAPIKPPPPPGPVKPPAPMKPAPPPGMVKPPSPGPAASATPAAKAAPSPAERSKPLRPPPPGPVQMPKDSELQRYLASLQRRVHTGRRRSWWLALAAAGLLLVSLVSWWAYYASSVLAYAELEEAIRVERIAEDPDRVALWYQPGTAGLLGFRRVDADRETELLDEVVSEAVGKEQRFEWRWSGVQEGSRVKVTYREGWRLAQRELQVPAAPSRPPLGDAVLQGEIVNATTNRPLEGAEIRIVGTPLSAKSGADGRFRLTEAPSGPVPIEISAANFSTDQLERELVSGKETPLRVALSPGMKSGQIRLVLTWAKQPADLDAHLEGPLPESKRFHIYFQEKGDLKSREFVNLDVDDRDGEGPETITVLGVLPGVYHYFVHDYTNRDATESQSLARSGAEVKVYQGGQTYRFQVNSGAAGTTWNVCDIEVTSSGATVKKVNTYDSRQLKTRGSTVDVVFLFHTSPEINVAQLKDACLEQAQRLQSGGLDCRFALIPFGAANPAEAIGPVALTGDLEEFKRRLAAAAPAADALPASTADALKKALEMPFRENVTVQFIVVTDCLEDRAADLQEVAGRMRQKAVKAIVYADSARRDLYLPLCQDGGHFRSLSGEAEPAEMNTAPSGVDTLLGQWSFDLKGGGIAEGVDLGGIYTLRTKRSERTVIALGGTSESERCVAEGLEWLARHQALNGHWDDDCLRPLPVGRCEKKDNSCRSIGSSYPMAKSGLALLAFQAGGHFYFNGNKYSSVVRRGLDWLVEHQATDGALVGSSGRQRVLTGAFMYEHGMATFALCEACAVAKAAEQPRDAKYFKAAKKAVQFMEQNQHNDGGWRYQTNKSEGSDVSVTGWQVLALKSAIEAGIEVDRRTIEKVRQFMEKCGDARTGRTGYTDKSGGSDAMTGVGMLAQQFLFKKPRSPLVQKAADYLALRTKQHANSYDYYLLYNCTLAMFMAGGQPWQQWNSVVRDAVVRQQVHQGCARGSWPAQGGIGSGGGRICATAWAVLTLEVYYRFSREEKTAPAKPEPVAPEEES